MSRMFLALHLPDNGLTRPRIVAVSQNADALAAFRDAVLSDAAAAVETATTDLERRLLALRADELRRRFNLVLAAERGCPP